MTVPHEKMMILLPSEYRYIFIYISHEPTDVNRYFMLSTVKLEHPNVIASKKTLSDYHGIFAMPIENLRNTMENDVQQAGTQSAHLLLQVVAFVDSSVKGVLFKQVEMPSRFDYFSSIKDINGISSLKSIRAMCDQDSRHIRHDFL